MSEGISDGAIKIDRAFVKAAAADLLEGEVRLAFTAPLSDSVLAICGQLSNLKDEKQAVSLTIRIVQSPLPLKEEPAQTSFAAESEGATVIFVAPQAQLPAGEPVLEGEAVNEDS